MNYIKFLFILTICQLSFGQQAVVKGRVIDGITKQPLADAKVTILGTPYSQTTNSNGDFYFENVPVGEQQFQVLLEGYIPSEFIVLTKAGNIAVIDQVVLTKGKTPSKRKILKGTGITGVVLDQKSGEPVEGARVIIIGSYVTTTTDEAGEFILSNGVFDGPQSIKITKDDYDERVLDIFVRSGKSLRIDNIRIGTNTYDLDHITHNTFANDELYTPTGRIRNSSRLYENSTDPFLNIAGTEFSSAFFRLRGQELDQSTVLINGISIAQPFDNRPDWELWDGLNEATENRRFYLGLDPSKNTFGSLSGSLEIDTRADTYYEKGKAYYGSSNRRFSHEANAFYSCGLSDAGLAYMINVSGRKSTNGYFDGSPYEAVSGLISVSKRIAPAHSLHFTGLVNSVYRGKYAANTQEVFDLKNRRYNPNWGLQSGEQRSVNDRYALNPLFLLQYRGQLGFATTVQAGFAYQRGIQYERRLDFNGTSLNEAGTGFIPPRGTNPNPASADKLPSAFLPDPIPSFNAQQEFVENGQVSWDQLYFENRNNQLNNATYAFIKDKEKRQAFTATANLQTKIGDEVNLSAMFAYERQKSNYFAAIADLLEGGSYLDIQFNGETGIQSDLLNPNREVVVGDQFRYNYELTSNIIKSFVQAEYAFDDWELFFGVKLNNTGYQRNGLYQNENAILNSFGTGEKQRFVNYGFKTGVQYTYDVVHQIHLNAAYMTNAPSWNSAFPNARVSDVPRQEVRIVGDEENTALGMNLINPVSEKSYTVDAGYRCNTDIIDLRVSGFYSLTKDAAETTPLNAGSIQGQEASFISSYLSGIDRHYFGVEFGMNYKILNDLSILSAASIGQYEYLNNPNLSYAISGTEVLDLGPSLLENYRLSNGPQKVLSLGFEHRNEQNWWMRLMGNYFADNFIMINPYSRTTAFFTDTNGFPLTNVDTETASSLLEQQKLDNYFQLNVSAGKYWKLKNKKQYIGFKLQVTNLLQQKHFLGGFETTTNQRYEQVLADRQSGNPNLGNAFWAGYNTSFYGNVYFRF